MSSSWKPDPRHRAASKVDTGSTLSPSRHANRSSLGSFSNVKPTGKATNQPCEGIVTPSTTAHAHNHVSVGRNSSISVHDSKRNTTTMGDAQHSTKPSDSQYTSAKSSAAVGNASEATADTIDRSVTIMYGPPTWPDKEIMSTQLTARLPKKVLQVLMRSKSKTESQLGGRSVLICFTTPYWYQNLPKVAEYLTTGDYVPRRPLTLLEVADSKGNTLRWSPETKAYSDVMDLATTEDTHLLFLGELSIYKWARYTHYDELKEHSLLRLCTEYPVFARECLALVEVLITMASDVPLDEDMKQFLKEAFARNKKTIAKQPNFTQVFEKAMGDNLLIKLLEGIQREVIVSIHAELCLSRLNLSPGTEAIQGGNTGSGKDDSMEEEPSVPQLDPSMAISRKVLSNLEGYIRRGLLGKAKYDGFGTLLPPQKDEFGRPLRNNNFRFRQGELLLIDASVYSFNGPKNVVVENMHGQRGDMLKQLTVPWAITAMPRKDELALPEGPVRSIAEAPAGPEAIQCACNGHHSTNQSIKHERSSSQTSEDEKRERRRNRFRSRSRSPRSRDRGASRRSRSRPDTDRYLTVYGRR